MKNPLTNPLLKRLLLGMTVCSAMVCSLAVAETLVMEFKGSASRSTPEFEVKAPWILDWRISTEGAYESAVDISLIEAGTGVHQGRVLMTKYPGNGVKLFDEYSGEYYFRVDSSFATWTLKVYELTEDEAQQYTPRKNDGPIR